MGLDLLPPETLERLTDAAHKAVVALSQLAAACIETCKSYEEAFRESAAMYYEEFMLLTEDFRMACAEIAELAYEVSDYDTGTSPKQYGIALIKRRERFCKSPTYSYFQKPKRHLPYQRRCF